jgi:glucokinase
MAESAARSQAEAPCAIGLDIGGTKVAAAAVGPDGTLGPVSHAATPADATSADMLALLAGIVRAQRALQPAAAAIGVGAAGVVDWKRGRIAWAANVGYHDLPLRDILSSECALPVAVDNDANAAAWAEARIGAGRGHASLAVLTVGTGIGGGLVLDRALYRGASGVSGEVGHMIVSPAGPDCGCGLKGCLEAMASGSALRRMARDAAVRDPDGAIARLAGGAANVTGEAVFAAAAAGDPVACSLFAEIGRWLGIGIALVVTLLDVELVVIGGGLTGAGDLLLGPVRASYAGHVFSHPGRGVPPIVPARLGREAGVIGAGLLALDYALGTAGQR